MEVGVRELKAKLSEFVGRAAEGEEVVVTDRGRPVARLTAFDDQASFDKGVDEGWIDKPNGRTLEPCNRQSAESSVMSALDDDRGN